MESPNLFHLYSVTTQVFTKGGTRAFVNRTLFLILKGTALSRLILEEKGVTRRAESKSGYKRSS